MTIGMIDLEFRRDINIKCHPLVQLARSCDNTIMVLHDTLANSKAYAGAFIFTLLMQPLKHLKYAFLILWVKTYTIISERNVGIVSIG